MVSDGTLVMRDVINPTTISQFKLWATNPERYHRGNAVDGNYYGKHDGEREYDVWWTTQPPREMWEPVVWQLYNQINRLFGINEWDIHVVDCISTRPSSNKVYAHIDTPYRFEEFAESYETLGVQIIIPLDDFTLENGGTAYLPGSSLERINYKDLEENREHYNKTTLPTNMCELKKHKMPAWPCGKTENACLVIFSVDKTCGLDCVGKITSSKPHFAVWSVEPSPPKT